ncbi:E3 ubiquitin-protein ligase MIB2 isoform X2 [Patella vulgata]|nr:E3 ubiquitin-protein ligase MIB2 isoform X2 [Patella vulgata]
MGIFPGAIVKRGCDWKWRDHDGGDGKTGKVLAIENSDKWNSVRNSIRVKWSSGDVNVYRLGAEGGKIDLQFVQESRGVFYYRDHLPVCEKPKENASPKDQERDLVTNTEVLKEGDRVCIMVSSEKIEELQKQHGSFSKGMLGCAGKTGEVTGFVQGDALVEFGDFKFRFFPGLLKKVYELKVGDIVRILSDEEKVRILLENHGGYNSKMKQYLGKVGQVTKIDSDGDAVVKFGRRVWVYNPACCIPAPGEMIDEEEEESDDSDTVDMSDLNNALLKLMGGLLGQPIIGGSGTTLGILALYKVISENNASEAISLIRRQPQLVNADFKGITPLVLASHQGGTAIVEELLKQGADINKTDENGNTALVAAIAGKERSIARLLISRGINVKVIPKDKKPALFCAAVEDYGDIVTLILQKGANANIQDSDGDTALHGAVHTGSDDSIRALCESQNVDPSLVNKKGFNALHLAAFKDRPLAVEKILDKNKELVEVKKRDGFNALHIATVNNHVNCARILIQKGRADVNCKRDDESLLTPLHLACLEGYFETVELLVERGADVNIPDRARNTPLHLALQGRPGVDRGHGLLGALLGLGSSSKTENRIKIAGLLMQNGASLERGNVIGLTPIDVCGDPAVKAAVSKYAQKRQSTQETQGLGTQIRLPCTRCFSKAADITLKPCDHTCVCDKCALQIEDCPLCNQTIHRRLRSKSGQDRTQEDCKVQ